MTADIAIECRGLTKSFDENSTAVYDLDLRVNEGEILAVLGPSGCGKTTTLRLIAGFIRPDRGEIRIGGRLVTSAGHLTPPEKRGVSMVFQEHALFPHMDVQANIAFGMDDPGKKQREVEYLLRLVGMETFARRFPHELSGGERQRVALARALAPRPIVILLDEPFSNLDADRRARMREDVRAILKGTGSTAIFVTHDQEEALYMGDCLAVLNEGRLEQIGRPEDIFHNPGSRFVAEFLGNTDFLPGTVTEGGIMTEIGLVPQKVGLPEGAPVELAVRFDDVAFRPDSAEKNIVLARHFKGAYNIYRLRLPSGRLLHAMKSHYEIFKPGTPVAVEIDARHPLACFHEGRSIQTYAS